MMRSYDQFVNRPYGDLRQQLLQLGMSETAVTMAMPQMWFMPATTDPYSPAVIMIVEAIQYTLGLPQTGYLDPATKNALALRGGAGWANRPWAVVVGEVLANRKQRGAETMYEYQRPMAGPLDSFVDWAKGLFGGGGGGAAGEMTFEPMETAFTVSGTTCIPTTPAVKRGYEEFQRQLNRAQSALGLSPQIKVDGKIGTDTLSAAKRVAGSAVAQVGAMGLATSCAALAKTATGWTPLLKTIGDSRNVPAGGGGGGGGLPSGIPERVAGIPLPIVAVAVGVGAVYWYKNRR
jgi:hypothetical protein